jgi:hypothetical protein
MEGVLDLLDDLEEIEEEVRTRRERLIELVGEEPDNADAMFYFAVWLADNDSTREALELLHKVTRADPLYPGVWRFKATLFTELGEEKMAKLCLSRAEVREAQLMGDEVAGADDDPSEEFWRPKPKRRKKARKAGGKSAPKVVTPVRRRRVVKKE